MRIRAGFKITYDCPEPCPMLLLLSVHPSRRGDLITEDWIRTEPVVDVRQYLDNFGNIVSRITAPAGTITLSSDFVIEDSGEVDDQAPYAKQAAVADLPDDVLTFLLPSRYCETDRLMDEAWKLFGHTEPGWARVQAIVDWTHQHIKFGYEHARSTKGAVEAYEEALGVCRDYAHLAITFCRCMNIPARYCTGYLGDIGVPPGGPMDFSAWFEVWLDGRWYAWDARNHIPRIGRILIAQGRDASDVAITTHFGKAVMTGFEVMTDEVKDEAAAA